MVNELTCKELVELITDYLEGKLPDEAGEPFIQMQWLHELPGANAPDYSFNGRTA